MKKRWGVFATLVVLIVFLCIGFHPFLVSTSSRSLTEWSQLGDAFGVINALFTGLAFAGVVLALYLQMEELGLQREEMKNSREELARSANAQTEQVKLLAQQIEAMRAVSDASASARRRAIRPMFKYVGAPSTGAESKVNLKNVGGLATDLRATIEGGSEIRVKPVDALQADGDLELRVLFGGQPPAPMNIYLECNDLDGGEHVFDWTVDPWSPDPNAQFTSTRDQR